MHECLARTIPLRAKEPISILRLTSGGARLIYIATSCVCMCFFLNFIFSILVYSLALRMHGLTMVYLISYDLK